MNPLIAPYLALGTAVNALNACADAMAQARKGDWDGFESALTRLDEAQLGVFIDYYGEHNLNYVSNNISSKRTSNKPI